jgi:hypothetical protein
MIIKRKETFLSDFRRRHSLRIHMSAILLATAFSGILFSKLFLAFSVDNFIIRYPLAVLFSYLVFFICIKLWLLYVFPKRTGHSNISDCLDVPTPSSGSSTSSNITSLHGGEGGFDGAGGSASFELHSSIATEVPLSTFPEGTSSVADGAGDVVCEAAGAIGEGGIVGIIVLAVLSVLIATILGSAVYILSEAPMILSEAAFEGLLAASLVKKTRIIDGEDWIGSVFQTTWRPFAITIVVAFFVALILHSYFPEATRLSDILK